MTSYRWIPSRMWHMVSGLKNPKIIPTFRNIPGECMLDVGFVQRDLLFLFQRSAQHFGDVWWKSSLSHASQAPVWLSKEPAQVWYTTENGTGWHCWWIHKPAADMVSMVSLSESKKMVLTIFCAKLWSSTGYWVIVRPRSHDVFRPFSVGCPHCPCRFLLQGKAQCG